MKKINHVPRISRTISMPPRAKNQSTLAELEIGDSIKAKDHKEVCGLRIASYALGITISSRKEGKGYRVWRVEKIG